ncbi:RNA polymerase sigma factor [Streptomyces sp. NPDC056669]|uniref:RNA polymerase sigma factor n=1 Tax=Streptomyces sp. NPDC056669 TaxID=3345903 RepID=UPI00369761D8
MVMRLRQVAFDQGVDLPSVNYRANRLVRTWEEGQNPQSRYRSLLMAVYGKSAAELGFAVSERLRVDKERWARVFTQYHAWVVRWLRARVADHALAEDLASEVFIKVGESLHKVDPATDDRLYGWLAAQARWVLVSHLRSSRVQREELAQPADNGTDHGPDPAAWDGWSRPDDLVSQRVDVQRVLALLSPEQREVVILHFVQGLTTREAGARLGLCRMTVNRRLNAAVAVLHRHLGGESGPRQAPDELWAHAARKAVLAEAATGRRFTSRDLVKTYELREPEKKQQWQTVFRMLREEGVIRPAGLAPGKIRMWVGATADAAMLEVAA